MGAMQEADVVSLYRDLAAHGVELWLMGGWGVDALLGRQTRSHHDLDVVVEVMKLERLRRRLEDLGFRFAYVWDDEVRWVKDESWSEREPQPTAFVYRHPDGREIDVHVVRSETNGEVTMLWTSPYRLTAAGLTGRGTLDGQSVRCLTAEMQRRAHTGYELPPHHLADMQLLDA
jgi:lincosamide nucleotidyltransferase A/C/D/E